MADFNLEALSLKELRQLQKDLTKAISTYEDRHKAEARAKDAENQLAGSRQVAEAAKLRGDKLKAENDALKKQPITAVVDKEEVEHKLPFDAIDTAKLVLTDKLIAATVPLSMEGADEMEEEGQD